jgi:hypothetical protein
MPTLSPGVIAMPAASKPPSDAEVVSKVGTALFGEMWTSRLADALGISSTWIRNLRRSHANLFDDQAERLEELLVARQVEIADALEAVRAWRAARPS